MRYIFASLALVLLLGCLGGEPNVLDFEEELVFEDVSGGNWNVEEIDASETGAVFEEMKLEKEKITVVYFYKKGCSACVLLEQWLGQEKKRYNTSVTWFEYDTADADGLEKYEMFADAYGVPENESYVPMAYVGGQYFWGIDGIRNGMGKTIDECHANGCYGLFEMLKDWN